MTDKNLDVLGSLGGIHIMNVSAKELKHPYFVSVGKGDSSNHLPDRSQNQNKYTTTQSSECFNNSQDHEGAFSLHLKSSTTPKDTGTPSRLHALDEQEEETINIELNMASICYIHSPKLLHDIVECLSDFKTYANQMKSNIRSAASVVASTIVKRGASGSSVHGHTSDNTSQFAKNIDEPEKKYVFSVQLDTPVIVFPKSDSSSDVLVAHLGKMSLGNQIKNKKVDAESGENVIYSEHIEIKARYINLYVVDLGNSMNKTGVSMGGTMLKHMYSQKKCGIPIMHHTTIEIDVNLGRTVRGNIWKRSNISSQRNLFVEQNVVKILATSTPIKLGLSNIVYKQVLETIDNLKHDAKEGQTSISCKRTPATSSVTHELDENYSNTLPSNITKVEMITSFHFNVPLFNVVLKGYLDERERELVDLKLYSFCLDYEKKTSYSSDFVIKLHTLEMEDLLASGDHEHKYLLKTNKDGNHDMLVHIKVQLIDKHTEEYTKNYNKVKIKKNEKNGNDIKIIFSDILPFFRSFFTM